MSRLFQYQGKTEPVLVPAAVEEPYAWHRETERPDRSLRDRVARGAFVAALPFFFWNPSTASTLRTDQWRVEIRPPQIQIAYPDRTVGAGRRAQYGPSLFFREDLGAPPVFTPQPDPVLGQPARRQDRQYPAFFFQEAPAAPPVALDWLPIAPDHRVLRRSWPHEGFLKVLDTPVTATGIVCGTPMTFQDDTLPDASLDALAGSYSFLDLALKCPGTMVDLGTTQKSFRGLGTIQNGDGVGTAVTTLQDKNATVLFDSGKTYQLSAVGLANRWTKLGTKIQGASGNPGGRQGCALHLGGLTTLRGNFQLYGTILRQVGSGSILLTPQAAGLTSEVIDCLIETTSGASNVQFGSGAGNIQVVYNTIVVLGGTGVLNNILVDDCELLTVVVTGTNQYFINTAATFTVADPILIGTPAVADIRYTGAAEAHLINPTWSGNAPQNLVATNYLNQWFDFDVLAADTTTGAVVSSVPIRVYDKNSVLLLDALTDAQGWITFGTGLFMDRLKVARHLGSPTSVLEEMGPFTISVNEGVGALSGYAGYNYKFTWPYRNLPSGYGKQYARVMELIRMYPPTAPVLPTPVLYGDVPIALDGEIRYEDELPEVT